MSKIYKSARGKMIDIDQIKLANENTIAVGNMKVNARGDKLGPGGQIAANRNQIMDQAYQVDTNGGYSPNDPSVYAERKATVQANRAKELSDLANNLVAVVPEEQASTEQPAEPAARGSLASSIAKTTTVKQEPLPNPKTQPKSSGPSRI